MASAAKKLIPLLDRVLIEKVAARTKTVGGILLPETAASKARALCCLSPACACMCGWRRVRQRACMGCCSRRARAAGCVARAPGWRRDASAAQP
jgi:hypothetical protein